MSLVDRFIAWAKGRPWGFLRVVTHEDARLLLHRYQPFWRDEYHAPSTKTGELMRMHRPPWWRPFNILLHHWQDAHREAMHDHPRWSITICLKGRLIEHTPWSSRVLVPGVVVFRSRKAIHAFEMLPDSGETWTLFIVGRRNHRQNGYIVKPFGAAA